MSQAANLHLDQIRLRGLTLARAASKARRVIASFDLDVCGIEIVGCDLIRTASNGLTIRGPVGCTFLDSAMHHAIKEAAAHAYAALGGADLPDWWVYRSTSEVA